MRHLHHMETLACQTCGKPCDDACPCPVCFALYYCSSKHRKQGQRLGHGAEECIRMQQQLARAQVVFDFKLAWPMKAPHDVCKWLQQHGCHDSGLLQYCCPLHPAPITEDHQSHMQQHTHPASPLGIPPSSRHSRDIARYPSLPSSEQQWHQAWAPLDPTLVPGWPLAGPAPTTAVKGSQQQGPDSGELQHGQGATSVHAALQQLQEHVGVAGPRLNEQIGSEQLEKKPRLLEPSCWHEYYHVRGLPEGSPAALALHFPLTLWYCLAHLLPNRGWQMPPRGSSIRIAYLGPQAELCMLPAFLELLALLPGYHLFIYMIGPDVPQQLHGKACRTLAQESAEESGSLTISCWNGCWHDVMQQLARADTAGECTTVGWTEPSPPSDGKFDIVFAANAGLPVFPSWVPTLQQLLKMPPHGEGCSSDAGAEPAAAAPNIAGAAGLEQNLGGQCIEAEETIDDTLRPETAEPSKAGIKQICRQKSGVPILFSDYCEEAAVKSQQMVQALLGQGFDLQAQLNPFRQPVPSHQHGTKLPACGNCVLFGWL